MDDGNLTLCVRLRESVVVDRSCIEITTVAFAREEELRDRFVLRVLERIDGAIFGQARMVVLQECLVGQCGRVPAPNPFVVERKQARAFQAAAPGTEARICRGVTGGRCEFRRGEVILIELVNAGRSDRIGAIDQPLTEFTLQQRSLLGRDHRRKGRIIIGGQRPIIGNLGCHAVHRACRKRRHKKSDPTVKRKTGFLMPILSSSSVYGVAAEIPYYWALAPDYDATFAPMITSKQGPLLQGEFRQRLINGAYSIRAAGIYQLDKDYFATSKFTPAPGETSTNPGFQTWRGSLESTGLFALNNQWVWGWDATALSDKTFLQDYHPSLSKYHVVDSFQNPQSEAISQLFLAGKGNRSYFDARTIYYYGFSQADTQSQIPVIHPVIDYNYVLDRPILGGEF